jgi:galactose-1-phosphate uridylyltransferase
MLYTSVAKRARLHSPLKNFELEEQQIEYRLDPLTGESTLITPGRADYVKKFFVEDEEVLRRFFEESKVGCPFCEENLWSKAARFPSDLIEEGLVNLGDVVAFPSLFAHAEYNAVIVLGRKHALRLNEFNGSILSRALFATKIMLSKISNVDVDVKYAAFVINFLPTAGSSVAHPHAQLLASSIPFNRLQLLISKSRRYFEEQGRCYWRSLIELEKEKGERYLTNLGSVEWYLPYAPLRQNEIRATITEKSSINDLSEEDMNHIAEGIEKALRFYSSQGVGAFNVCLYSALGESPAYFWAGLEMASRPGVKPIYLNDIWSLPLLLNSSEVFEAPEALCRKVRPYFEDR